MARALLFSAALGLVALGLALAVFMVVMFAIGLVMLPVAQRVVRASTLALKHSDFVTASRVLGATNARIIVRHILPNTMSYVIVAATISVPSFILGEVVLSFIGVGVQAVQDMQLFATITLNGVTLDRLADRKTLLAKFDDMRREADATGAVKAMDAFTEQAFGLLTSSRMADALDLSKEPQKVIDRYGTGDPKVFMDANGAPRVPQSLLMARRLVEAGARVVTLNYSKWDWHGGMNAEGRKNNSIFLREEEDFPIFDKCVSALVEDLHDRGLTKKVLLVVTGEFGQTIRLRRAPTFSRGVPPWVPRMGQQNH